MPRIFLGLSGGLVLVLFGAAGLGMAGAAVGPERHILLAVFALLLGCLVQVVVLTYLNVTGKLIAQALHAAHKSLDPLMRMRKLKRRATHLIGLALLSALPVIATGAQSWRTADGSNLHLLTASLGVAIHLFVLYQQYGLIVENASIVASVLAKHSRSQLGSGMSAGPQASQLDAVSK